MLEWVGDKLAILSSFPWSRSWIGLVLGIAGAVVAWMETDLPWPFVMLGFSVFVCVWGFVASLAGPNASVVAGILAFLMGLGANAVHKRLAEQKCTPFDRYPIEVCADLKRTEGKPNG